MQVPVENLNGLSRRMQFSVSEERIYQAVQDRIDHLSGRVEVKGFRPGKAPRELVEQQIGHQVRQEVIGQELMKSFYEAARQRNLSPAGPPEIEPARTIQTLTAEWSPEFVATFEVYPDVQLVAFESIRIERPRVEVTDGDVERMLASLQLLKTQWIPVERPAAKGDRLIFDLQGEVGGVTIPEAKEVPWVLGAPAGTRSFDMPSQMEFEERLYGCRAGDSLEIAMSLPEIDDSPSAAGKSARFQVRVTAVAEPSRPELNDAFAEQFGIAVGGLAALRDATRENMEREGFAASYALTKQRIFDALTESNPCDLPAARLQREVERLLEAAKARQLAAGAKEWQLRLRPEQFEAEARRHVTLAVILAKIVGENELKADRETVDGVLESLAAGYENPGEVKNFYREHPELMADLESTVLEDVVVEWLLPRVQVVDVRLRYPELVKSGD